MLNLFNRNVNRQPQRMSFEELESRLVPDASGMVQGLYQQVLQRSPSTGEVSYWAGRAQTVGNAEVIHEIVDSHESHTVEVKQEFQDLLHRSADAGGLNYFAGRMDAGETFDQMRGEILGSAEYQASHSANLSFVNGLYQDLLGRSADAPGQTYWANVLQQGTSRSQVIQGFLNSNEALGLEVKDDYTSLLGRSASDSEEGYWVAQYHQGESQDQIRQAIVSSPEWQGGHGSGEVEAGDDNGGSGEVEVGDDNGGSTGTEVGDDSGGHGGRSGLDT